MRTAVPVIISALILSVVIRIFAPPLRDLVTWCTSFDGVVVHSAASSNASRCDITIQQTSNADLFSTSVHGRACRSLQGARVSKGTWSWSFRIGSSAYKMRAIGVFDIVGLGAIAAALALFAEHLRRAIGFTKTRSSRRASVNAQPSGPAEPPN
jgi:hypothetical protein